MVNSYTIFREMCPSDLLSIFRVIGLQDNTEICIQGIHHSVLFRIFQMLIGFHKIILEITKEVFGKVKSTKTVDKAAVSQE